MTNQAWKPSTGTPSGGQSPIMKVDWELMSWSPDTQTYNAGQENERSAMRLKFKFDISKGQVHATKTGEPWVLPIAEIVIPYTDPANSRGGTRWDNFTESGRKLFGKPFEVDSLVGWMQTWEQLERPLRQALTNADGTAKMGPDGRQEWGDVMTPCWCITGIDAASGLVGVGAQVSQAQDLMGYMAEKAEGLDEDTFHAQLIKDQRVTSSQETIGLITSRQLVPELIRLQRISRDATGILHTGAGA